MKISLPFKLKVEKASPTSMPGSPRSLKLHLHKGLRTSSLPDVMNDKRKAPARIFSKQKRLILPSIQTGDPNASICAVEKTTQTEEYPSLSTLVTELYEIYEKWRELGIKLGLTNEELKSIENDHGQYSDRCLINVLDKWLKITNFPTWTDIVDVLNSEEISEPGIATRILREYW